MAQFFIDRPVFAWVIAILITLGGVVAIFNLPVEAYPTINPPQIVVNTSYPGADAKTLEQTVTQVIEQQLTGIDGMVFFTSTSNSDGSAQITLTFETGTDPDVAAVQTQNRVALAEPRLPTEVIQQGIRVSKANAGFLMAVALRSRDGSLDSGALGNLIASRIIDPIQRIPGVGSATQFGGEYAMRIWLNPDSLHAYGLSAAEVLATVRQQNVQFASGSLGSDPAVPGQQTSAPVTAEGRFTSPEQFRDIILRAESNGTTVRLKDVARVEIGLANYGFETRVDNVPNAAFAIQLLPGANALEVVNAVRSRMEQLGQSLPASVEWFIPFEGATFIVNSIKEVAKTLAAAVVLVFVVMLLFLQNLRATLIPTLVVPAALMGAFIGMYAVGFSINQLSLFGMVLAIGIVVDDAIVVIEATERLMREEHLSPREATRKAMGQITGAIVTITVVLAAVFIPSALQGGSTGAIYRQFALTIAISMAFSAFLALSFTPALCAAMLKPEHLKANNVFRWFNRAYERSQNAYLRTVARSVHHTPRWMAGFAVLVVVAALLFARLPSSFVPDEDQGRVITIVRLPPGATLDRTMEVMAHIGAILHTSPAVKDVFQVGGFGFSGRAENTGIVFVLLKPWHERDMNAQQFLEWANATLFMQIKDASVFTVNVPTIGGLGSVGGFDFYLEDRAGRGHEALVQAQDLLLAKARQNPGLQAVRSNQLQDSPRVTLSLDRVQAQSMGLSVSDVYGAIQLMLAPVYVNDFFYEGRILRVLMQADAPYRMDTGALARFSVPAGARATHGSAADTSSSSPTSQVAAGVDMVPLSNVVSSSWMVAPPSVARYNGFPAIEITGQNAGSYSSGDAMAAMERMVREDLPQGFGFDWAGQSLEEIMSGAQAPLLFVLSILVVYLCLAALYESWATPLAVMLIVPLGALGAVLATTLRGLPNDVFFKIGLITIIGLSAKNAILIVEYAVTEHTAGKGLRVAVLEAARLRLRPILMTSFAFILGVMPLVVSTGAGANARRAIGTGVAGGMLTAALLGVLLVPVFYVAVRWLVGERAKEPPSEV